MKYTEDEAMYTRVTRGKVNPDKLSEATAIYRESVIPAARKQPGFKSAFLMGDPEKNGKYMSITMWDTKASMNESESSGYYKEQMGKVAVYFSEQPTIEHYEVSVSEFVK